MVCPSCSTPVPDGARFCPACGSALVARPDERRVVTVLFADLVGFTALSEQMDPEHLKNLVDRCFQVLVADVVSFGGQVDKIIGDAIVALFGAPVAHEDDAERAVRAALRMQQTLANHARRHGLSIRMRIGVNTGEVLVGALRAGGDYTAMGDVVNTAQRLEAAAEPGQVLVGPATHAGTQEAIRFHHLGPIRAKGREEPVEAWAALEPVALPGRRPRRRRAPLVGRSAELGLLGRVMALAAERSRAQLVVLTGEAGVGKNRLAEEAVALAEASHEAAVLEGRCLPYGEANVWWPFAEALRSGCGVAPAESPERVAARVRGAVAAIFERDTADAEVGRVSDGLLHLMGERTGLDAIDPARARDAAVRALVAYLDAYCRLRPVVLVLSDLHWADDAVLGVIDRLLADLGALPFVLVATARTGLAERWSHRPGRNNAFVLNVDPLDRASASAMLMALSEGALDPPAAEQLLDRSGGNPLFIEELAAFVSTGGTPHGELPDGLRGIVAARLDQLSAPERAVLDDAAVLGRTGAVASLQRLGAERGGPVTAALAALGAGELLSIDGPVWSFHSEAVREVAYNTLTKASRALRHVAVARLLEADHDLRLDGGRELVAAHWASAAELVAELGGPGAVPGAPGDVRTRAVVWLARAGDKAFARDLSVDTYRLAERAIELLGGDPESLPPPARDPVEAELRRRLLLLRGWACIQAPGRDRGRARADIESVLEEAGPTDDGWAVAGALTLLGELDQVEFALARSIEHLDRAVELWRAVGDRHGVARALRIRGMSHVFDRRYAQAEADFTEAIALSTALGDRRGEAWATQNLAWISFVQGAQAEAEGRLERAVAAFEELGDTTGTTWAQGLLSWVRFQQGRLAEAEGLAREVEARARSIGDAWGLGMMLVLLAALRLWSGRAAEAVELAGEAKRLFRKLGDTWGMVQLVPALSRALVAVGRVDEAQRVLESGFAAATPIGYQDLARVAAAGAAVHLGDSERALGLLAGVPDGEHADVGLGVLEYRVHLGLALLHSGEAERALVVLDEATAIGDGPSAYVQSALALARAAVGDPDGALEAASAVTGIAGASYLDRLTAEMAIATALAQRGDVAGARDGAAAARRTADATDDVVAQGLARLAQAEVLARVGLDSDNARRQGRVLLDSVGVAARGWERALRLAAWGGEPAAEASEAPTVGVGATGVDAT